MNIGAISFKKPDSRFAIYPAFCNFGITKYQSMTKIEEIWKPIPNYDGIYSASTTGLIKNNVTFKVLLPNKIGDYYGVTLCRSKKDHKVCLIHRLVAMTWIDNPNNKPQVNHIDGNKLNNNYTNLEWVSKSENSIHSFKLGLQKPNKSNLGKYGKFAHRKRAINCLSKDGIFIKKYDTIKEASDELKISVSSISNCLSGRSKSANGYLWQ